MKRALWIDFLYFYRNLFLTFLQYFDVKQFLTHITSSKKKQQRTPQECYQSGDIDKHRSLTSTAANM